jgi:hypothetical protein
MSENDVDPTPVEDDSDHPKPGPGPSEVANPEPVDEQPYAPGTGPNSTMVDGVVKYTGDKVDPDMPVPVQTIDDPTPTPAE